MLKKMKYAKYILIVVGLYFGFKYHNEYLKTEKEIQSIEFAYKEIFESKIKKHSLNTENNTFVRDSAKLILDQKYLILKQDITVQYLQGKFDKLIYNAKLQELKKSESEESSANTKSWLVKYMNNTWPSSPVPDLLYEKRNSTDDNSNALFVLCGLLFPLFLLIDWEKGQRQSQTPIQNNQYPISTKEHHNNQMIFNGKTLTRQKLQLEEGSVIDEWIGEDGNPVEVPEDITQAWDKQRQVEI